jgi:hypothetical protein
MDKPWVFQVKQYHRPDCNAFDVFGRVMSGTVFRGDRVKILGALPFVRKGDWLSRFRFVELTSWDIHDFVSGESIFWEICLMWNWLTNPRFARCLGGSLGCER